MRVKQKTYYDNPTKFGAGALAKLVRTFTTKPVTGRWTIVIFCNILDIIALNAFTVWPNFNLD